MARLVAKQMNIVMVTGSCPGAGKTSVSALLSRSLQAANSPTCLLSENRLLQLRPFASFDDELFRADPGAIKTLIDAIKDTFGEERGPDTTWITDALLPGWFWLLGRYPLGRIEAFNEELAYVLRPLRPLIVYLGGDVDELFGRAVAERGEDWSGRFLTAVGRWQVPLYPGRSIQTLDDMLDFLAWVDHSSRRLLDQWPGDRLLLDAGSEPIDVLAKLILESMGM